MTELFWEIAGSWIRAGVAMLTGYLVTRHVITAPQGDKLSSELATYLVLVAPGVLAMLWGAIQKYRARVKLNTALDLPSGSSEDQVKTRIANGLGAGVRT